MRKKPMQTKKKKKTTAKQIDKQFDQGKDVLPHFDTPRATITAPSRKGNEWKRLIRGADEMNRIDKLKAIIKTHAEAYSSARAEIQVLKQALSKQKAFNTPNGYDTGWVDCINIVLQERDSDVRITDIDEQMWDGWLGPMIDDIEDNAWPDIIKKETK